MFWFKEIEELTDYEFSLFQYIICFGSRTGKPIVVYADIQFQYIICFGSSNPTNPNEPIVLHFNTLYVLVQEMLKPLQKQKK